MAGEELKVRRGSKEFWYTDSIIGIEPLVWVWVGPEPRLSPSPWEAGWPWVATESLGQLRPKARALFLKHRNPFGRIISLLHYSTESNKT